jgi:hypothetical protein
MATIRSHICREVRGGERDEGEEGRGRERRVTWLLFSSCWFFK